MREQERRHRSVFVSFKTFPSKPTGGRAERQGTRARRQTAGRTKDVFLASLRCSTVHLLLLHTALRSVSHSFSSISPISIFSSLSISLPELFPLQCAHTLHFAYFHLAPSLLPILFSSVVHFPLHFLLIFISEFDV